MNIAISAGPNNQIIPIFMLVIIRVCPVCGEKFEKKKYDHLYCRRKCFKIAYRKKMKIETFPSYKCPECNQLSALTFFPKHDLDSWTKYKCPHCGHPAVSEQNTDVPEDMKRQRQHKNSAKPLLAC